LRDEQTSKEHRHINDPQDKIPGTRIPTQEFVNPGISYGYTGNGAMEQPIHTVSITSVVSAITFFLDLTHRTKYGEMIASGRWKQHRLRH